MAFFNPFQQYGQGLQQANAWSQNQVAQLPPQQHGFGGGGMGFGHGQHPILNWLRGFRNMGQGGMGGNLMNAIAQGHQMQQGGIDLNPFNGRRYQMPQQNQFAGMHGQADSYQPKSAPRITPRLPMLANGRPMHSTKHRAY